MKRKKRPKTRNAIYRVYMAEIAATNNIDNMKGIKENRRNEKSIVSGESNLVYLVDV